MYTENVPDKRNLRFGYTTGSCATASTKAALTSLITKNELKNIEIELPVKKIVNFEIKRLIIHNDYAIAATLKDGGDDPDVTTGLLIYSRVCFNDSNKIMVNGGTGVGTVTKDGLPIKPGNPAINPVPLKMINNAVKEVLDRYNINRGVTVTVFVPGGEEVAKKTCNPRLGIMGGISILGTRGIVIPFSDSSWKASIVLAIRVAKKANINTLVLSTGGRSDDAVKKIYNNFSEEQFIEIGDFIGFSLKRCIDNNIDNVIIAGMPGKLSKLAYGYLDLHSSKSKVDFNFLANIASELHYDDDLILKIKRSNTVLNIMNIINYDDKFLNKLNEIIIDNLNKYTENRLNIKINIIKNDY